MTKPNKIIWAFPPLHSGQVATGCAALPCSTALRTKPSASLTRHFGKKKNYSNNFILALEPKPKTSPAFLR